MATQLFGLPDDELDKLLREAETRLAARGGGSKAAVLAPSTSAAKAVTTPAALLPPSSGDPTAVSKNESAKLSVRVPQLGQKK